MPESFRPPCLILILVPMLYLFGMILPTSAQESAWTGQWQSYWRDGSALLTLEQRDNSVTGRYQPFGGEIEGKIGDDGLLTGEWRDGGGSGEFTFALAPDGETFTGRFDTGEFWNGYRETGDATALAFLRSDSPRETLRTIVSAANNAIYNGDPGALRFAVPLIDYAGPETNGDDHARRQQALWVLLDMSTFRVYAAPDANDVAGQDAATFAIGPADVSEQMDLSFRRDDNAWRLVLPPMEEMQADIQRFIAARGFSTLGELEASRAHSPRQTLRDFILGVNSWEAGGRETALETLDLSRFPERLQNGEGTVAADYLKRILDRAGFVIWQSVPDVENRPIPYVHFRHPEGNVAIVPIRDEASGEVAWKFSAETVAALPDLYRAMETMPPASGVTAPPPLSDYFLSREWVLSRFPGLGERSYGLEDWQWIGIGATILLTAAAYLGGTVAARGFGRATGRPHFGREVAVPVGLLFGALVLVQGNAWLGLSQSGLLIAGGLMAMLLVVALAALLYALADMAGGFLHRMAEQTSSYTDEIMVSLGTGLAKLLIVVGGIIASADVVGLPYEGVLTGLGIGGVALAFAARDTVSNVLGGALLLADRPFRRGDLVEAGGQMATIEDVGLRSTRLRTLEDTLLIVPNAQLSDQVIANWSSRRKRRLKFAVGLTYDTPRAKLTEFISKLTQVVKNRPLVDPEGVHVGFAALNAHSLDIDITAPFMVTTYDAQVSVQQSLLLDIMELAEEVGVEFAFPTQTLHLAQIAAPGAQRTTSTPKTEQSVEPLDRTSDAWQEDFQPASA